MPAKTRIDLLLVERGLAASRSVAQRLIMAGQVRLEGQLVHKPSELAEASAHIDVTALPKYVSRGGEKLEAALKHFGISPSGWICADVGASTGGFTDCLLQAGAQYVYAIDVGKGQLHYRLRGDPRVNSLEATNVRHLEELPELVDLVVVDVSFISLSYVFPIIYTWLKPEASVITLIKPQFEAGRAQVGKGGVVRDPLVHAQVLRAVLESAHSGGFCVKGLMRSPLRGPKGNVEFLSLFTLNQPNPEFDSLISQVLAENPL